MLKRKMTLPLALVTGLFMTVLFTACSNNDTVSKDSTKDSTTTETKSAMSTDTAAMQKATAPVLDTTVKPRPLKPANSPTTP